MIFLIAFSADYLANRRFLSFICITGSYYLLVCQALTVIANHLEPYSHFRSLSPWKWLWNFRRITSSTKITPKNAFPQAFESLWPFFWRRIAPKNDFLSSSLPYTVFVSSIYFLTKNALKYRKIMVFHPQSSCALSLIWIWPEFWR